MTAKIEEFPSEQAFFDSFVDYIEQTEQAIKSGKNQMRDFKITNIEERLRKLSEAHESQIRLSSLDSNSVGSSVAQMNLGFDRVTKFGSLTQLLAQKNIKKAVSITNTMQKARNKTNTQTNSSPRRNQS